VDGGEWSASCPSHCTPNSCSGCSVEETNLLLLSGIKPWYLSQPAYSLVTALTELSWLTPVTIYITKSLKREVAKQAQRGDRQTYSCTPYSILALESSGCSMPLGKRPSAHCIGCWMGLAVGLDENPTPPLGDHPAHSKSLYLLWHPGHPYKKFNSLYAEMKIVIPHKG
jgi:hypothetical protein